MAISLKGPRAIAEVLLIALGILLGLSAESWLAGRAAEAQGQEYIGALMLEFEEIRAYLTGLIEDETERIEVGATLIRASTTGSTMTSDEIRDQVVEVLIYPGLKPPNTIAEQLVASGDLSLIDNAPLTRALANWRLQVESSTSFIRDDVQGHWNSEGRPFFKEKLTFLEAYEYRVRSTFPELPGDFGQPPPDYQALLRTKELREFVAGRLIVSQDFIGNSQLLLAAADLVLEQLAGKR